MMYPFRAVAEGAVAGLTSNAGMQKARRDLDAMIGLYFLEAGEAQTIFWKGRKEWFDRLRAAALAVESVYDRYPGSVEAVPDFYGPGDDVGRG